VIAQDQAVSPFYWTLEELCVGDLLPFVFADAEDELAQSRFAQALSRYGVAYLVRACGS
jgi:hypothetical protein